jgi:hypothetical protein
LFFGVGGVLGTGIAELVVRSTGRSRRIGVFMFLASIACFVGLILLSPFPGELLEAIRPYSGENEPAWYFLVVGGAFGGLSGAGADLI